MGDANKSIKGGLHLRDYESNFNWIFDAQMSLTTKDGRVYVSETYFESDWRWYLDAVPAILKESAEIFNGERTEEEFNEKPSVDW